MEEQHHPLPFVILLSYWVAHRGVPSADVQWIQLNGDSNEIEFISGQNAPSAIITSVVPGTYLLEYSFSRMEECYLADTVEISVLDEDCDSLPSECLLVDVSNIQCINNGTADTTDDHWVFDIVCSGKFF